MPDTSGLSFYQTDDVTTKSITYGFDVLSADDITVIAIASNGARTVLTVESGDGYGYTVNLTTKTVTYTGASWDSHPLIYPSSSVRVYRTTSVIPSIDFTAGAVLSESDLDTAYKQGLFAAQEMTEDAADTNAGLQSVTSGVIAAGAVTAPKIATNSISEDRIINLAVTNAKIADNAVNAAKIQNGTVGSSELAANCVTTAKIGANQVTTTQILNNAVTQAKVVKAGKANMEALTGSSGQAVGVVTPDVLRYSQFAPRAYGSVAYNTGSESFSSGSYNVQSVANTSTSQRTITFSTPMSDVNYFVSVTGSATSSATNFYATVISKTVNGFVIDGAGVTETDTFSFDFVVFGSTLSA
ncbi:tail fiber protein [uncultured phage_MedDCM-OCT-S45-C18]|uniref:Tail fiber protein n=1 Tax=uncultured phage_MedDCM-OCT-S45-C18 TaxID=2741072 RepID=A0A6S4PIJ3_9CAUD|nr:tail fiber protein [uncultured phage_MedDCM-OCT-S45-C18]BAQ94286.1 hypothetical protein [uncultured phage_MedDCM-OCT-S45-C18]